MSIIAMNLFRPFAFGFLFGVLGLVSGCTEKNATVRLPFGKPVLASSGAPLPASIRQLEISARPPSVTGWHVRLAKGDDGKWRITRRSDEAGADPTSELADGKLIRHFVETLGTFITEGEAGRGNGASFGLNPYRTEVRFGAEEADRVLRLGDPWEMNGIYFRLGEAETSTWTGRGALIAFLPTLDTPDAFRLKTPYASEDEIESLALEKLTEPGRGTWSFVRSGRGWREGDRELSEESTARVERIFRQRVLRIRARTEGRDGEIPLPAVPDWRITYRFHAGAETLSIFYQLDEVVGTNPARTGALIELYPEFAGALRSFTQSRFTSRRSGTK